MTDQYIEDELIALRQELLARPNKAQYAFNTHINKINNCIEKRYSLNEIFEYIYQDIQKPTFSYFKNLIYRARLKSKKSEVTTSTQETNRRVINEPVKTDQQNTIIKQRTNPLAHLSEPKKQEHDSSSDINSLNERVARMLKEQENQND